MTAEWVGDCFIYTTAGNRVGYFVGNKSYTISPSDMYVLCGYIISFVDLVVFSPVYILGYIPARNRVYLSDKDMNIYGYALSFKLSVVEYQTTVLRGDMGAAAGILPTLPKEHAKSVPADPSGDLSCVKLKTRLLHGIICVEEVEEKEGQESMEVERFYGLHSPMPRGEVSPSTATCPRMIPLSS